MTSGRPGKETDILIVFKRNVIIKEVPDIITDRVRGINHISRVKPHLISSVKQTVKVAPNRIGK